MDNFAALRNQLRSVCLDVLGEELTNSYIGLSRPALGLRKVNRETRSHFGGEPALPPGSPWPVLDGSPLALLVALDLAEFAALRHCLEIPADGFLNIFFAYDRRKELEAPGTPELGALVYCRRDEAVLRSVPGGVKPFRRVGLEPMELLTLPSYEDPAFEQMMSVAENELLDAGSSIRFDQRGTWHQLGGWPTLLQASLPWSEEDEPPRFLLQLDYDEDLDFRWLGGGIVYFAVRNLGEVSGSCQRTFCCLQL